LGGWHWGRPLWRHAAYLYHQRQTLAYAAPPDQVVFEGDPNRAATLIVSGRYGRVAPLPWSERYDPPLGATPGNGAALHKPPPVVAMGLAAARDEHVVVFAHHRRSPGGRERLVVVVGTCYIVHYEQGVTLRGQAYSPAGWIPGLRAQRTERLRDEQTVRAGLRQVLRVFAGQADPADESHFTIRYQMDGREGVVDGWLRDPAPWTTNTDTPANCERVELVVRRGPAAVPRMWTPPPQ